MTPSYYEIRIVGVLPPEALLDFERLTASVEPVETVLHGPLPDVADNAAHRNTSERVRAAASGSPGP